MTVRELEFVQMHAALCQALADPKRLLILDALRDGESSVNELVEALGLPQPNVSQHLSVLRDRGLVRARREGQRVLYSVEYPQVIQAMDLLREVMAAQMTAGPGD
ncbi:MAG: metalloregulator ArsR/SmtB family transcription factor [Acidimicrobiia bacterium]|jgi:ArsR family transcriptional regulator, virulence genes transcriptional regulator